MSPARVSVAALDPVTGEGVRRGDGVFVTASVVKADILAALLLRARDTGRAVTAAEWSRAAAMIGHSDNDAASVLWRTIGSAAGLDAANARIGLTETVAGDGGYWGLTRTTAPDRLVLLRELLGRDGEAGRGLLDQEARDSARRLMAQVVPAQAWGVPVVADGSAWAVKNGWMPRDATGLWVVHSVGRVTSGGRDVLLAVLSDGHATMAEGVVRVEAAARTAVAALRSAARGGRGRAVGGEARRAGDDG
ncbi:serine hydrolase [Streptomyces sp. enrichment culture]|uniref:serine hydrolase n=1 Tax=Streptomyces sp. enrichment culture TaxID=1795815 RepID=UPI003F54345D